MPSEQYDKMKLKLDAFLKPYPGDGRMTFATWYDRFKTICQYQGWETEEERARYMVLLLDGAALQIAEQMPYEVKENSQEIAKRLLVAFAPSAQEAHSQLISRKWRAGESVELLYYELVQLWKQATRAAVEDFGRVKVSSDGEKGSWEEQLKQKEELQLKLVIPFFLHSLPTAIATQLVVKMEDLSTVDKLLTLTRTLVAGEKELVVGAVNKPPMGRVPRVSFTPFTPKKLCYRCQKPGHYARDCQVKPVRAGGDTVVSKNARLNGL